MSQLDHTLSHGWRLSESGQVHKAPQDDTSASVEDAFYVMDICCSNCSRVFSQRGALVKTARSGIMLCATDELPDSVSLALAEGETKFERRHSHVQQADTLQTTKCSCKSADMMCIKCEQRVGYEVTDVCDGCPDDNFRWFFPAQVVAMDQRVGRNGQPMVWTSDGGMREQSYAEAEAFRKRLFGQRQALGDLNGRSNVIASKVAVPGSSMVASKVLPPPGPMAHRQSAPGRVWGKDSRPSVGFRLTDPVQQAPEPNENQAFVETTASAANSQYQALVAECQVELSFEDADGLQTGFAGNEQALLGELARLRAMVIAKEALASAAAAEAAEQRMRCRAAEAEAAQERIRANASAMQTEGLAREVESRVVTATANVERKLRSRFQALEAAAEVTAADAIASRAEARAARAAGGDQVLHDVALEALNRRRENLSVWQESLEARAASLKEAEQQLDLQPRFPDCQAKVRNAQSVEECDKAGPTSAEQMMAFGQVLGTGATATVVFTAKLALAMATPVARRLGSLLQGAETRRPDGSGVPPPPQRQTGGFGRHFSPLVHAAPAGGFERHYSQPLVHAAPAGGFERHYSQPLLHAAPASNSWLPDLCGSRRRNVEGICQGPCCQPWRY